MTAFSMKHTLCPVTLNKTFPSTPRPPPSSPPCSPSSWRVTHGSFLWDPATAAPSWNVRPSSLPFRSQLKRHLLKEVLLDYSNQNLPPPPANPHSPSQALIFIVTVLAINWNYLFLCLLSGNLLPLEYTPFESRISILFFLLLST